MRKFVSRKESEGGPYSVYILVCLGYCMFYLPGETFSARENLGLACNRVVSMIRRT